MPEKIDTQVVEDVAREVLAGYRADPGPEWDGEKAVRKVVTAPSLGGLAYDSSLPHRIGYAEGTPLRRGYGLIVQVVSSGGVCTGATIVYPARDDYCMQVVAGH